MKVNKIDIFHVQEVFSGLETGDGFNIKGCLFVTTQSVTSSKKTFFSLKQKEELHFNMNIELDEQEQLVFKVINLKMLKGRSSNIANAFSRLDNYKSDDDKQIVKELTRKIEEYMLENKMITTSPAF